MARVALRDEIRERPDTNCWEWQRARSGNGYGAIGINRLMHLAHRVYYEELVGPIPDDLTLDHLCENRCCVNPGHLEPVSARENLMRSVRTQASINAAKTHCKHGHPFDEKNTRIDSGGWRQCRRCQRDAMRRYRAKEAA